MYGYINAQTHRDKDNRQGIRKKIKNKKKNEKYYNILIVKMKIYCPQRQRDQNVPQKLKLN